MKELDGNRGLPPGAYWLLFTLSVCLGLLFCAAKKLFELVVEHFGVAVGKGLDRSGDNLLDDSDFRDMLGEETLHQRGGFGMSRTKESVGLGRILPTPSMAPMPMVDKDPTQRLLVLKEVPTPRSLHS